MGEAFNLEEDVTRTTLIDDLHRIWGHIYSILGLRQGLSTEALRFAATLHLPTRPSKPLGEQDSVDELRRVATDAKSIRSVAEWLLKVTQACDAVKSDVRQDAVTQITQARLLAVALHAKDMEDRRRRELLAVWERVSFRIYGLWDKDARTGVGDYVRLAWDVINEKMSVDDIHAGILDIGSWYPIQDAVKALRKTNCYSGWTDDLRYLLFRYEEHLARERRKKVDNVQWELVWSKNASLSIEHIWPQSAAPEDVKHTLGNLMLLPPGRNSQLGDQSPGDKVESYRETGFLHAAEVADMLDGASWSKKACEKRERKILEWASQEWGGLRRTGPSAGATMAGSTRTMRRPAPSGRLLNAVVGTEEGQLGATRRRGGCAFDQRLPRLGQGVWRNLVRYATSSGNCGCRAAK